MGASWLGPHRSRPFQSVPGSIRWGYCEPPRTMLVCRLHIAFRMGSWRLVVRSGLPSTTINACKYHDSLPPYPPPQLRNILSVMVVTQPNLLAGALHGARRCSYTTAAVVTKVFFSTCRLDTRYVHVHTVGISRVCGG